MLNPEGFAGAPVFDPGLASYEVFDLDPDTNQYFSYGTMILPSNDAFIANGNPTAHQLFDDAGEFVGPISFVVYGSEVLDAGTEANTESDAPFLNQSAPNTGETTTDVITLHPGFNGSVNNPAATPVNILGGSLLPPGTTIDPVLGDFSQGIFPIMRVTISANSSPVRLSIKNTAAAGGTFLTPVWVGFHDGSFDTYDRDTPASVAIERIAEDGTTSFLVSDFATEATTGQDAVVLNPEGFPGAPVYEPGSVSTEVFNLDSSTQNYFSYASMIIPSNDAFISNGSPTAHRLFDDNGTFIGPISFSVYGSAVLDAGTEDNTEVDAAFLNQTGPDTGVTSGDVITIHPGFNGSESNPNATPVNILGGTGASGDVIDATAGDFSRAGAKIAEFRISNVVDGGHSGSWYNPARSGHGLVLEITDSAVGQRAVVSWYHYAADGSGEQIWLTGVGPVVDDTAIVEMIITEGAVFGDAFNADDVTRINWGQLRIKFDSCTTATLEYNSLVEGFGSGSEPLTRLTSGPAAFNGACQL
ncbi:Alkaline phosphatase [hydrothermal vent metagenome]|uniref:Alkaline phosphatase n=1 Tax=hydrothermal vent metagenome TaxID=652676 RepID=A0A3B0VPU6_9ZZZZ